MKITKPDRGLDFLTGIWAYYCVTNSGRFPIGKLRCLVRYSMRDLERRSEFGLTLNRQGNILHVPMSLRHCWPLWC
jgi:hypothetical protein